MYNTSISGKKT